MDMIDLLDIEFEKKREKNKNYSLRAFARDLKVPAASLSHIMKRKRPPSDEFLNKAAKALKLTDDQKAKIKNESQQVYKFSQKEIDYFMTLSEWYYDAIIELMRTKGFESNSEFIAKRLGMEPQEIDSALERLENLGMIKKNHNNMLHSTTENILVYGGDNTLFFLQKIQKQLLNLAVDALDHTPKPNREQASMVMAINKKDLPEAKARIKQFHHDLSEYLQRPHRESDEVYQLVTSFFPLTKIED